MPDREHILTEVTTVTEAAELAGVTRGAVYDAIRNDKLTTRRSGATQLLLLAEVLARWPAAKFRLRQQIGAKSPRLAADGLLPPA